MEVKFGTIDRMSKTAPASIIKHFKSRAKIHVSTNDEVDLNFLKIGETVKVIGIDPEPNGMMFLNFYKRIN